jgi:hypothetical protein
MKPTTTRWEIPAPSVDPENIMTALQGNQESIEHDDEKVFQKLKEMVERARTLEEFIDVLDKIEKVEFFGQDPETREMYHDIFTGRDFLDAIAGAKRISDLEEGIIAISKINEKDHEDVIDMKAKVIALWKATDKASRLELQKKAEDLIVLSQKKEVKVPEQIPYALFTPYETFDKKNGYKETQVVSVLSDQMNEVKFNVFKALNSGETTVYLNELSADAQDIVRSRYLFDSSETPDTVLVIKDTHPLWRVFKQDYDELNEKVWYGNVPSFEEGVDASVWKQFFGQSENRAESFIDPQDAAVAFLIGAPGEDGEEFEEELEDLVRSAVSQGQSVVTFNQLPYKLRRYLRTSVPNLFGDKLSTNQTVIISSASTYWSEFLIESTDTYDEEDEEDEEDESVTVPIKSLRERSLEEFKEG